MSCIRNSAKAVIVKDGKVMLQRCIGREGRIFYELPGGGQHQYETMEEAVIRECLEETGYTVKVERFIALYEEIFMDDWMRKERPAYAHRLGHVFLCGVTDTEVVEPSEPDNDQDVTEWVEFAKVAELPLHPKSLRESLCQLVREGAMAYLGIYRVYGALPMAEGKD